MEFVFVLAGQLQVTVSGEQITLPDAGTNTLVNLDGNVNVALGGPLPSKRRVAPALAFLTLGLYIAVFLTVPAVLTARRNVM